MLSISRSLSIFAACVVLGLITILGTTHTALNQLRIGGQPYRQIIDAKDLVADILPPPLYVIEAYLEAKLAVEEPDQVAEHKARIADLKKDFDARRDVWRASSLPRNLRDDLLERSSREADLFWSEVVNTLIPSLQNRRDQDVKAAMERIDKLYRSHRKVVDETVIAATQYQTEAEQAAEAKNLVWNWSLYITSSVVLALVLIGVVSIHRRVVMPIEAMTQAMRRLAEGDEMIDVPARGRRDEIGSMAEALQIFKASAIAKRELESKADEDRRALDVARAAMDVERTAAEEMKTRDLLAMVEQVERETKSAVSAVVGLMDDMTGITREMLSTANELSENSDTVAKAASETQTVMQSAHAATERLSLSIDKVAQQVRNTHEVTATAVRASENTGRSIEALSLVVNEITGVTKLITDIARQTSLLAINAGVEATRSGQDGKGFAVIAMEVKNLSEQTSVATNKISDLVRQVHSSTGSAVDAVSDISRTIQGVNQAAAEMARAIDEQVTMTRNIATSVYETTNSAAEVTKRVQQVAREAGSTGVQAKCVDDVCIEVAEHVRSLHSTLVKIVRTCSVEIDRRSQQRVSFGETIELEVHGRVFQAVLSDLSSGGAQLRGRVGAEGERVRLYLPSVPSGLTAHIINLSEEATHLQFEPQQPALADLERFLSSSRLVRVAA